ncbi:MAG: fused MFS/spermidine synthase, partial [Patescibacteria group bacterium]
FSAFLSGFAVMAVEMSASRLLAPYFGNSLYVWTNVIGLVMISLAIGYALGGRLADKNPNSRPYFFLILATAFWILAIPFLSPILFQILSDVFSNLSALMLLGSFIAVLLLLAVPMIFLGMIVPFTVKLVTGEMKHLGTESGKVSALSTGGSILGTFFPAFILIPHLGTMATFLLLALLLMALAACGLRNPILGILSLLGIGLFWVVPPVYATEGMTFYDESPYQFIFVKEAEEERKELYIDNTFGMQSVYDPNKVLGDEYYSFFGLLPALVEQPKKALILGHAGGSISRILNEYYPDLEITGVELDPRVTDAAVAEMGLDLDDVKIVHGDARVFLQSTEEEYDLIFLDAYHLLSIPSHLATREFFALVNEHLSEKGVVGVNALSHESSFLEILRNSLALSVGPVLQVPMPTSQNSLLIANRSGDFEFTELPSDFAVYLDHVEETSTVHDYEPGEVVFTDDKSAWVELQNEAMVLDLFSF